MGHIRIYPRASAGDQFPVELAGLCHLCKSRLAANRYAYRDLWIVVSRGGVQCAVGLGGGVEKDGLAATSGNRRIGDDNSAGRSAGWASRGAEGKGAASRARRAAQFS